MFENKKIEILRRKVDDLSSENMMLEKQNRELLSRVESMESIVKAAQDCIHVNDDMRRELALAKSEYELALKEITKIKKDYKTKMDKLLKSIQQ